MTRETQRRASTNVPSAPPEDGGAPNAGSEGAWESLDGGNFKVRSMNYMEEFKFVVKGPIYMEWMPRLSRSEDGTVPVLPCQDLDTGEDCVLIMPGMFQSWIRREKPPAGTKLALKRLGKDADTGAWKIAVKRL